MMIGKNIIKNLNIAFQAVLLVLCVSPAYSSNDEEDAGKEVVALYLGAAPLVKSHEINRYVNLVGRRLADVAGNPQRDWVFGVIDTESLNAFSAPGGFILITKGLFNFLESEDELAAVLAHEISHVSREHHWKIIKQQKEASALITKMQSNMKNSNDLFKDMNSLFTDLMTKGLDKGAEFEADRDAIVIAANAGYDSSALFSVMMRLNEDKGSTQDTTLLFKTHPTPSQRIDVLTEIINSALEDAAILSHAATRLSEFQMTKTNK